MASIAKNVALSFGVITAAVTVEAGTLPDKKTGNVTVCTEGHDPQQIRQPSVCDACAQKEDGGFGEVPYQQLKKARPVDGGFVVLEGEEIVEAAKDVTALKKKIGVSAHPAEQVQMLTSAGKKAYYLVPEAGHEQAYATLLALIARHTELAFMSQWVPRSAASQFQVVAFNGVLMLQERIAGTGLRPSPSLDLTFNDALVDMAEAVLAMPASKTEYDPATYVDTFEQRIAAIVKGKEVVTLASAEKTPVLAPTVDLMAALQAQLATAEKPKRVRASRAKVSK